MTNQNSIFKKLPISNYIIYNLHEPNLLREIIASVMY
jgi:hypothetical protein